jgi:hypothetical protein
MNTAAIDLMGDGQSMGVAVDWKLEARLKEEYRSEKDDNDAIDALRMLGVLATEDDKRWFGEHPDRRAYVRMIVQEERDIFPFRKLALYFTERPIFTNGISTRFV